MNLFSQKGYVKQMLPPKWRAVAWKLNYALILTKPLTTIYKQIVAFREDVLLDMNITPQVMVLEAYLQRNLGISDRLLFIRDTTTNGQFEIYLSVAHSSFIGKINTLMTGKSIAGSNYTIITF